MRPTPTSPQPQVTPVLVVRVTEADGRLLPRLTIEGGVDARALALGRAASEVVEVLPRLFNLCRGAQEAALRLAVGLPVAPELRRRIGAEILRDHVVKLCLVWPRLLGLAEAPPPPGWAEDAAVAARAIFGPDRGMPADVTAFTHWLEARQGVAPVLAAIRAVFGPGEALSTPLPFPGDKAVAGALENSAAARQAGHPVLTALEARGGRGPLWRAAARLADVADCLAGRPPAPGSSRQGQGAAPSSRGLYSVSAQMQCGQLTALERRTPTDDMVAPGGAMETAIRALPPEKRDLLPLLVDIFDPCMAVRIELVQDA